MRVKKEEGHRIRRDKEEVHMMAMVKGAGTEGGRKGEREGGRERGGGGRRGTEGGGR